MDKTNFVTTTELVSVTTDITAKTTVLNSKK